ncbi:MAG: Spy/CpxP family protein refolding chaperone [Methylophilus sp.]|nr:Spy/CpxP family protein refolding chaperone [Methylophilus sp.]
MQIKNLSVILLGAALTLPGLSFAASFPCDQSQACLTQAPNRLEQKPAASLQRSKGLTDLIQNLKLSEEQSMVLYHVVQKQMPEVSQTVRNLEQAQATLRNMAVNKQYDETVVNLLAQTIAENTANLAILQVQREYEVLSMLTPEQAKRYQQLAAQNAL